MFRILPRVPFARLDVYSRLYFPLNSSILRLGFPETFLFVLSCPLRPWDLSHRVERQKLIVNRREEMSVRVQKGGFMAS